VFGGVGVYVLVEGVGKIYTAMFFNPDPCAVGGDCVEEGIDVSGVWDGGRACNVRKLGEEGSEMAEYH